MLRRSRWGGGAALVLGVVLGSAAVACDDPAADPPVAVTSPVRSAPAAPSSAVPSAGPAGTCADATLGRMSLAQRAGQVLMVGTPVDAPEDLRDAVGRRHLGGVFLAGRSTRRAAGLRADIAALQRAARVPLLVALDQEGGSVQTLKGPDFPLQPSALRLGRRPAADLRAEVRDSARRLAGIGVTVNLAPVADTVPAAVGEANPPIGAFDRQYGADPGRVADAIRTAVPTSQDAGVLTVLKHFPGLGRVRSNTDTSTRAVDRTADAGDPHLEPFTAGIRAGSAAVMMSSASYPRLDPRAIAVFSEPIITGLLRGRLGYTGLVMSDDLGAADAAGPVPTGDRAVRFLTAGGDLVLTVRPGDAGVMAGALISAARRSPAFDARLAEAARQVLRTKERAGVLRC